jgi:hypothetical protein
VFPTGGIVVPSLLILEGDSPGTPVCSSESPESSNEGILMNRSPRAALALAAAVLTGTGVAVAPQLGSAAPARATTHTLKLLAHQTANHNIGPNRFVSADTDRSPATGKVRGYDSITGSFNFTTHKVKIDAAVALKGGLITAHLVGSGDSNVLDGVITGGTGKYKGIKGTIHTRGNKATHITFTYTL